MPATESHPGHCRTASRHSFRSAPFEFRHADQPRATRLLVVNQSFIFHLPFPSPRTKNKRGCCARVARSDLYSLVPVVSCSCLTSLCVKPYASATVSLNILYNQIVRHCTGGG